MAGARPPPHQSSRWGGEERFAVASRPGSGQWAATAEASSVCRAEGAACPGVPQLTCQALALGERATLRVSPINLSIAKILITVMNINNPLLRY